MQTNTPPPTRYPEPMRRPDFVVYSDGRAIPSDLIRVPADVTLPPAFMLEGKR